MQFKFALILLVSVAFCVAEASSRNRDLVHLRNKRSINKILKKAGDLVKNGLKKVEELAKKGLEKLKNGLQELEGTVLRGATGLLKGLGVNINLQDIADLAKMSLKGCASQESVKKQVANVRDSLLTCIAGDLDRVKAAIKDIGELVEGVKKLPQLLSEAIQVCKTGGSWWLSRVIKCGKAVFGVIQKAKLTSIPGLIAKHIGTATSIVIAVKTSPVCLSGKMQETGEAVASIATEVGTCVKDSLSSSNTTEVAHLKKFVDIATTVAKFAKNLG